MSRRLIMTPRSLTGGTGREIVAGQATVDHGAGRVEVEGAVHAHRGRLRASARVEELVLLMPPRELRAHEIPGELVELGPLDRLEPGRADVALEIGRALGVEVVRVRRDEAARVLYALRLRGQDEAGGHGTVAPQLAQHGLGLRRLVHPDGLRDAK